MSTDAISPKRLKPQKSSGFVSSVVKIAGTTVLGATMLTSAAVSGGLVGLAISFRNLPDVRSLQGYVPSETTHIYDINGQLLASLHGEENREVVALNQISPELKRAVLAIEDSQFYHHQGINPIGVLRAATANFVQGSTVEGGSTVTMQLVKNLFLSPERTLSRKSAEAVLALRMEQVFAKDKILEMYLNQVYWGHNTYGVEMAARSYFNKPAAELTLAESAMMAGVIQAPEAYSPFVDYDLAKRRQEIVLNRMQQLGWITAAEVEAARQQPLKLGSITSFQPSKSPYVTDTVIAELKDRFGEAAVLRGGMRVQTTVDSKLQKVAEETVRWGHNWLRSQGVYADQMALVAVDPRTHFVKAIVGGINHDSSQYNRAVQALRQPGSAFKPFVYYTAFASGKYSPDSTINDSPVSYPDGSDELYRPENYDDQFIGTMTVRKALALSRNVPAVKLGQEVGINRVIEVSRTLGIESPIQPVISLPLGAVDLTPLEMAGAYATFANGGWKSDTTIILQVTDNAGHVLLDNRPKPKLVLDPWAVAALNSALQDVINSGTGVAAQIGRPAAGKTGTTSSERDIWFVGYVPQLAAAVWVGNDDYTPLGYGATGGGFVAPIWRDFMTRALKDVPVERFPPLSKFERPRP